MPEIEISDIVHATLNDIAFVKELTVDEVLSDLLGLNKPVRTRIDQQMIGPADLYQILVMLIAVASALQNANFSGLSNSENKRITFSRKYVQDQIFEILGTTYFLLHKDELQNVSQGLPRWKNRVGNALAALSSRSFIQHTIGSTGRQINGHFEVTSKGYGYLVGNLLNKSSESYRTLSVDYPKIYDAISSLIDAIKS
ncbi:MAG TPA: hypothetical protein DEZ08_01385 [Dehalococcoidia bacterium]|jgi:hypothetical protein|nr:hypothetical protein [Dehalococcoidia bacterium]